MFAAAEVGPTPASVFQHTETPPRQVLGDLCELSWLWPSSVGLRVHLVTQCCWEGPHPRGAPPTNQGGRKLVSPLTADSAVNGATMCPWGL